MREQRWGLLVVAVAAAVGACQSAPPAEQPAAIVQPGAPGSPGRLITADEAARLPGVRHSEADVRFMQAMIAHHAQAVEMTSLLKTRTSSDAMRKLGERIELSQADEIRMMEDWLTRRGVQPDPHAHHAGSGPMPGMLTREEMDRLAAASGERFDRLFLELMIRHHEGALVMVRDLFAHPGAAQESEIFAFAADVDADQRMEIARMAAMLRELTR